jgi:hypothetical protein
VGFFFSAHLPGPLRGVIAPTLDWENWASYGFWFQTFFSCLECGWSLRCWLFCCCCQLLDVKSGQMALVELFALPAVEMSGPAYGAGGLVLHREAGLVLPKRAGKVKLNKYFGTRT